MYLATFYVHVKFVVTNTTQWSINDKIKLDFTRLFENRTECNAVASKMTRTVPYSCSTDHLTDSSDGINMKSNRASKLTDYLAH